MEIIEEKSRGKVKTVLYIIIRLITAAVLAYSAARGQWENAVTCLMTLGLLLIPSLLERKMRIGLPVMMEILMISFVFAANILGEISAFYQKLPMLDTALLKLSLSPLFVVLFSFCFSMTAGAVWEFFEFGMDVFFGKDMQKDAVVTAIRSHLPAEDGGMFIAENIKNTAVNGQSLGVDGYLDIGLYDTMKDLLVNFAGAVVFNTLGFVYLKGRKKHTGFIKNFIPEKL